MKDFRKYYISIAGGLGNQMLSYSLWYYLTYIKKKKTILFPITEGLQDHNKLEINILFQDIKNISEEKKSIRRYRKTCSLINKYLNKIGNILGIKKNFDISYILFTPLIIFPRYQTYTFISEIIDDIRLVFKFPHDNDTRNRKLAKEMEMNQSVSIHVRRGDYQSKLVWRLLLGDICEKQYYDDAIAYIKKQFSVPKFYIFSDDITWCKQNLKLENAIYINWNNGKNSFRDMQLMTHCKANIIANSTFSLMATWLNIHSDCIHIVPSKWTNTNPNLSYTKYIPSDWVTINNSQPFISIIINNDVTYPAQIVNSILSQNISDYEIILPEKYSHLKRKDDRIKIGTKAIGHHILKINNKEWKYGDRYYLQKLIIKHLD